MAWGPYVPWTDGPIDVPQDQDHIIYVGNGAVAPEVVGPYGGDWESVATEASPMSVTFPGETRAAGFGTINGLWTAGGGIGTASRRGRQSITNLDRHIKTDLAVFVMHYALGKLDGLNVGPGLTYDFPIPPGATYGRIQGNTAVYPGIGGALWFRCLPSSWEMSLRGLYSDSGTFGDPMPDSATFTGRWASDVVEVPDSVPKYLPGNSNHSASFLSSMAQIGTTPIVPGVDEGLSSPFDSPITFTPPEPFYFCGAPDFAVVPSGFPARNSGRPAGYEYNGTAVVAIRNPRVQPEFIRYWYPDGIPSEREVVDEPVRALQPSAVFAQSGPRQQRGSFEPRPV